MDLNQKLFEFASSLKENGWSEQTANEILKAGMEATGLPIGIISHVEGPTYTVLHACSDLLDIPAGTTFDLNQTYCDLMLKNGKLAHFNQAKDTEWGTHPCYNAFKMEAYIAAPIRLPDGNVYGTFNFSSPQDDHPPFQPDVCNFIESLADLIGKNIVAK
ncbi:MAG: GAF domain-containing protein [Alphaproteobacteria bacterium]|nr:GAF domain-containing protein [Alphaproteobacteria bacterium]MDD9919497.1 GAF domain-containing protein [Alphaproteobacteria bacterium]